LSEADNLAAWTMNHSTEQAQVHAIGGVAGRCDISGPTVEASCCETGSNFFFRIGTPHAPFGESYGFFGRQFAKGLVM
jgi:hypothetical protein